MKDTDLSADELAYSRVWLRFHDPETERKFARRALSESMGFIRVYLAAGTFLYMLFGLLDIRVGGHATAMLFMIRYLLVCPILLAVLAFTFTSYFEKIGQAVLASTMMISGLGIVAMTAIMPAPFNSNYYGGLIMVVIYCGSFIRVDFLATVAISVALVLAYEVWPRSSIRFPPPISSPTISSSPWRRLWACCRATSRKPRPERITSPSAPSRPRTRSPTCFCWKPTRPIIPRANSWPI